MKVIITGGGTGGHIYPAVSIAREIKNRYRDAEIIFVGTEKGLESKIVPKEGLELKLIKVRGLERKLSLSNIAALKESVVSLFEVRRIIRSFRPDIVIGTGGYVCGSVLMSAALMNIPTLIHESNAIPGVTNKILSKFVDKVALNFPEAVKYFSSDKKLIVTGNPIRNDMLRISKADGLRELGFSEELPLIFVVGGSRGAKKINESVLPIAEHCAKHKSFQLLHMTGETQYEETLKNYESRGIPTDTPYLRVVPYLYNMPYALAACDLAVSRCGALTLSEITALGKPSILIPYPYAAENHQEYNGRALEKNGAAIVILEKDLSDNLLYNEVLAILGKPDRMADMAKRSRELAKTDAVYQIVNAAESLLRAGKKFKWLQ